MATSNQNIKFVLPTSEERASALGETDNLDEEIRRALTVDIDSSFLSIPVPNEGDWLSIQKETGQTVKQFERSHKTRPRPSCNVISIQPIGDFSGPRSPHLDIVCDFSHLFFPGCQTEILPSIGFDYKMKKRINSYTNQPQYLVPNLVCHLKKLQRKRRNRHELFAIGVTMADIYPRADWNFVYGSASVDEGIGIYSFARLDPLFPHSSLEILQRPCTNNERVLILHRAVSTYLHEVMHLFGLEHCTYYACLMNGANCENEMDQQLLYLCPICLRKMFSSFGREHFHIMQMYRGVVELSHRVGFQDEVKWYENRLKILEDY